MIELSNGIKFEFAAASGALSFDGKGWIWEKPLIWTKLINTEGMLVVAKTVTLKPRVGNFQWYNPFYCIRLIPGGVVNAFGLSNPGFTWWNDSIGSKNNLSKLKLAASLYGEPGEISKMASELDYSKLAAIEINASCPNTEKDIAEDIIKIVLSCKFAHKNSRLPIILKLSVVHDIEKILPEVEGYIEAVSINSIPWNYIFPYQKSPLHHLGGGGVSGEVTNALSWELISRIRKFSNIPIIASAIWNFEDLEYTKYFGASAYSFGSIFLVRPWRPTKFMNKFKEEKK